MDLSDVGVFTWARGLGSVPTRKVRSLVGLKGTASLRYVCSGALPELRNVKGETAVDLAKTNDVRQALGGGIRASFGSLSQATLVHNKFFAASPLPENYLPKGDASGANLVPNYIAQPELDKLWSVPEVPAYAQAAVQKQLELEASKAVSTQSDVPSKTSSPLERELLVYQSTRTDNALLGAIFVSSDQTISDTVAQISEEIDDVPPNFAVHRHNGSVSVPLNKKQMGLRTVDHFKTNDAIVLVPKS
ncbi:hypothetical protein HDV00_003961 [Rhizophlyctis rosea]|nr:hypothetical protein HDV00_003961 [Rhizophlyctis rosea]